MLFDLSASAAGLSPELIASAYETKCDDEIMAALAELPELRDLVENELLQPKHDHTK